MARVTQKWTTHLFTWIFFCEISYISLTLLKLNINKKKKHFQIVQELEGCPGPSIEYTKFPLARTTGSMDPNEKTSIDIKYFNFDILCHEEMEELEGINL